MGNEVNDASLLRICAVMKLVDLMLLLSMSTSFVSFLFRLVAGDGVSTSIPTKWSKQKKHISLSNLLRVVISSATTSVI
jgi:hypothetical protein